MRRLISRFISRISSKNYLNYLKMNGAKIGEGTVVFYPRNVFIDNTRPWMIEIGKNVQITKNVSILTHDYSWSVIKGKYGIIAGSSGKVKIGDNVFIGFNSTIMRGVTIGDNVIIGANSVVSSDIPSDCVACGNPATVLMSIEEFKHKREKKQVQEACELALEYMKTFKREPDDQIMREFMFLYKERSENTLKNRTFDDIASLMNNYDKTIEEFNKTKPKFNGLKELIKYAQNNKENL